MFENDLMNFEIAIETSMENVNENEKSLRNNLSLEIDIDIENQI